MQTSMSSQIQMRTAFYDIDLPCLEGDFDDFVSNLLLQRHEDALIFLIKLESRLVQEGLNVLQLSIILIFILDLLFEGPGQLLRTIANVIREATRGDRGSKHGWTSAEGQRLAHGVHTNGAGEELLEGLLGYEHCKCYDSNWHLSVA